LFYPSLFALLKLVIDLTRPNFTDSLEQVAYLASGTCSCESYDAIIDSGLWLLCIRLLKCLVHSALQHRSGGGGVAAGVTTLMLLVMDFNAIDGFDRGLGLTFHSDILGVPAQGRHIIFNGDRYTRDLIGGQFLIRRLLQVRVALYRRRS
jgi:hypothetical protein